MLIRIVVFILIIGMLLSCDFKSIEDDHIFIEKIKKALVRDGGQVWVSELHPGSWKKVCFSISGDSKGYDNVRVIEESEGKERYVLRGMNRGLSEMTSDGFTWGILFYYPPDGIEYFKIDNQIMFPRRDKYDGVDEYNCVLKELAVIQMIGSSKSVNDSILIKLISKESAER